MKMDFVVPKPRQRPYQFNLEDVYIREELMNLQIDYTLFDFSKIDDKEEEDKE